MKRVQSVVFPLALSVWLVPQTGAAQTAPPGAAPTHASGASLSPNVELVESYRGVDRYRLKSNGMPILLVPNHAAPVVSFMVVYHVGSRNEAPGNTGSAHLLEHMIFNKSTENFGKGNGHPTFQEVLYEAGADFSSTNMTTWLDRMNGYSTLPSNKLELAMKIEADRLGRALLLDSERQSEMSVVRNEYEIGENDPYRALSTAVTAAAIVAHPYHWSTIGYRSDIEGVTTEKLREHYKAFFHPDNSEAILVGDFDPAQALALFDREFGGFAKSTSPIPRVITVEPPQQGERRVIVKRPGALKIVQVAFPRPGSLDPDFITLDVLASILGEGISSRLYRGLVEPQLASDIDASNYTLRDPYLLTLTATVAGDVDPQKAEDALKATAYQVAASGVTPAEVARAQQQIEVAVTRSRDGAYRYASALGEAVASANWKWFLDYLDASKRVTPDDVKRVAAKYLVPDHATVGWFVPAAPAAPRAAVGSTSAAAAPAVPAPAPATAATPPVAAAPASVRFADRARRKVLPNGLIVDVLENHSVPTVAIQGLVLGGDSTAPAGKPALPQLVASMVQRGTATRTKAQIAELLESRGATLAIAPNAVETAFSGNGMSRDTPLLLEILADELRNPSFPADELTKARSEARSDILRSAENTTARAIDRITQLVFADGHPYRAPGHEAMLASLDAITVDDLKAFHRDRYAGSATILSIVGDVDATATIAAVERFFGGMPKGARPALDAPRTRPSAESKREVVRMPGKANMTFVLGEASGLRRNDADYEAALIANAALGQSALSSRIGKRVRDTEGLSYSLVSRFLMTDLLDGVFGVIVNVAPQNLAKALASTDDEIAKYAREGANDAEIGLAKSFFAGNYQVGLGSNSGVAAALVTAEKFGYGPRYLDEYPERIRRVTKDEVNRVIRARLLPDRLHLVVAGDIDTPPAR